jgi:predicted RNase H-like nuclease (RuvC/YqgF family)
MGKSTRGIKEFSKEQETKHENRELRKQIRELEIENRNLRRRFAGTRKEFARMDLDRHAYVKDIIEEHLADDQESMDSTQLLEKMISKWRCHEPGCSGHLEVVKFSTYGDQTRYYRQCNECSNRTKGKPWHQGVEGPIKPPTPEPTKLGASQKPKKSFK